MDRLAKNFRAVAGTASHLGSAIAGLELEARELAIRDARNTLINNLKEAIAQAPEFQHPLLEGRLLEYFIAPERILMEGNNLIINVDNPPSDAARRWIKAQEDANEARQEGTELPRSPLQKATYWRYKIYDEEPYEPTLQERFAFLEPDDAPFWYFLEFGTGPLATPSSNGTFFLQRTSRAVEGTQLFDYYLKQLLDDYEQGSGVALGKSFEIGVREDVKWSKWYRTKDGKGWQRHQYSSATGGFITGGLREVVLGERPPS